MNEDLTRQLLRRIAALERRLGIQETIESGSFSVLRANSAAGLSLQDDGGNVALTVNDGGNVGIGGTPNAPGLFHVIESFVTGATYHADDIFVLERNGNANLNFISGTADNSGFLFSDADGRARGIVRYLHNDDSYEIYTAGGLRQKIDSGGNHGIGAATPQGKLHVDQSSTTAAIPVLILDQADLSEEFIEFTGTVGTGNSIEAVGGKTLTTTHFIRINITGVGYRYIPVGTIA